MTSNEKFIKEKTLQGLSLRDVQVSVLNKKNKPIIAHQMDMIFTHFGVSGPAILRCSQFVVKELQKGREKVPMKVDLKPDQNVEQVIQQLSKLALDQPKKTVKNAFKGIAPERFLSFVFEKHQMEEDLQCANLSKELIRTIAQELKNFTFHVHGSLPMEKAFVTGGGVAINEIVPNTMQSKRMHGLFFCGEILDIHGYTGGYNITSALVTGRI